jgi:hypothetical protein
VENYMKQKYDDPAFFASYSAMARSVGGLQTAAEWPAFRGLLPYWPIDDYQQEGLRHTKWMADDVIKYHRTTSTYVNTLIDSGFCITKLLEPAPTPEMLVQWPESKTSADARCLHRSLRSSQSGHLHKVKTSATRTLKLGE